MRTPQSLAAEFARLACMSRASLPPNFQKPRESLRPAWEAHFASLGLTGPAAFLDLLDCDAEVELEFGGWGVLSAEASKYYQSLFGRSGYPLPLDGVYGAMLPIFCRDGDLLLLDRDGAVYAYQHDGDTQAEPPVAPSFDALLVTLLDVLDGRAEYPLDLLARSIARAKR
ncbi:MAG: hypothetical protein GQE15_35705 [Archangiaceae bacterium]|nr:hypothetical protein [Archangiaceae bacterium]